MSEDSDPPSRMVPAQEFTRRPTTFLIALAVVIAGTGCRRTAPNNAYQGYLEGEYVYVASPYGGALRELNVSRGDKVTPGQVLFALDPEPEAEALHEANEKLRKARAQLVDLQKGKRPSEIEAIEAQQQSAKTDLQLAEQLLQRREQLSATNAGAVAAEAMDESKSRVESLRAQVARLGAELETARLGARDDQIKAATAEVDNYKAAAARTEWTVEQKKQSSTVTALVHDTLYRPGEWVAPGSPVVVLLPPENIKVRFFVPEVDLAKIQPGEKVRVGFDGSGDSYAATISYISTRAEYTPPVIYSQQTRSKLVYMIEAKFATNTAVALKPGQPVDVELQP